MATGPPEPPAHPPTGHRPRDPRRIRMVPGGPMLVEGPVEVTLEDGRTVASDRFMVAMCMCRRSRAYPFCDTSHRRTRVTTPAPGPPEDDG